jgi:DNA repair ATPase RecN
LSNALGAELEADPDFQPWVQEISAHLTSVQEVSSRLDAVLQSLQRDPSSP